MSTDKNLVRMVHMTMQDALEEVMEKNPDQVLAVILGATSALVNIIWATRFQEATVEDLLQMWNDMGADFLEQSAELTRKDMN